MEMSHIVSIAARVEQALGQHMNEAMTKTSLIMPFIQAMGYDVFDHTEVAAEYTSDFGTKRGEKIDFAILKCGEPVMLIECKPLGDSLDTGKCSQLFRYFSTQPARIGMLTNGQRYLFFSDLEKQNVMDAKPFMEIDMLNFNERDLPEIQKLTKEAWDIDSALSSAETLKFVRAVKTLVAEDVADPSDDCIRLYASQCYNGKMTARVLEMFRPIVKRAFSEHVSDQISKRLNSLRQAEEVPVTDSLASSQYVDEKGIITHNTEMWGFVAVRALISRDIDPIRVCMRDQKSYCGILLDDNIRKPICKFYNFTHWEEGMTNIGKNAHVVIFTASNDKGERYDVQYIDDIYKLQEKLVSAAKRHL